MEPMTLGSPSGSPLPTSSSYLPSFLMGEPNTPTTPRNNTLSPTKGRTSLAFTQSPTGIPQSPEFNRSNLQQKFLLGYQQGNVSQNFMNQGSVNHNSSVSGPPTQGLFDSFRSEKQAIQTPSKSFAPNQGVGTPAGIGNTNQSMNESCMLNQSGFNVSRIMSPIPAPNQEYRMNSFTSPLSTSQYNLNNMHQNNYDYWITVFGFPQNASSIILTHFSQCGTIIDKIFSQNGNWVHLRFTSRLECDKALNYNGKIIGQNLMIGVTYCTDPNVVGKENNEDRREFSLSRVRSLTHIAYKTAQNPTDVVPSPSAPKRSSGIVNKAMDLFFGW